MIYEVILDSGETANKCTIAPLADRADFRLFPVRGSEVLGPLRSLLLLHPEGQCLTRYISQNLDKGAFQGGIATIDCVWRRLDTLVKRIAAPLPLLVRIPEGFETAYPRRSKQNTDPAGGLATIEAIFAAGALLGKWDATLLNAYHFGRRFVELNAPRFLELGVHQAGDPANFPVLTPRLRHSLQRRRDRGRR